MFVFDAHSLFSVKTFFVSAVTLINFLAKAFYIISGKYAVKKTYAQWLPNFSFYRKKLRFHVVFISEKFQKQRLCHRIKV